MSDSRRMISPGPHPASTTLARAGSLYRSKSGRSCGQIAFACAARLRTIDSCAICSAWGFVLSGMVVAGGRDHMLAVIADGGGSNTGLSVRELEEAGSVF